MTDIEITIVFAFLWLASTSILLQLNRIWYQKYIYLDQKIMKMKPILSSCPPPPPPHLWQYLYWACDKNRVQFQGYLHRRNKDWSKREDREQGWGGDIIQPLLNLFVLCVCTSGSWTEQCYWQKQALRIHQGQGFVW